MMDVSVHISSHEQIDKSIAIIVSPGRAGAESSYSEAGFFSHVLKLASAFIAVEDIMPVAGHIQIRQAIIVKIGDRKACCPTARRQSRRFRNVSEMNFRGLTILLVEGNHQIAAL